MVIAAEKMILHCDSIFYLKMHFDNVFWLCFDYSGCDKSDDGTVFNKFIVMLLFDITGWKFCWMIGNSPNFKIISKIYSFIPKNMKKTTKCTQRKISPRKCQHKTLFFKTIFC